MPSGRSGPGHAGVHGRYRRSPPRSRAGARIGSNRRNARVRRRPSLDLAPVRVNLIAAGFVDTALSASLLGDHLDARREQLRTSLPIRRVVAPVDVAALAVHVMINETLTRATYDIEGGQQLVPG